MASDHPCCCSVTQSCPTLYDPMDCSTQVSLSCTVSQSLLKLMSIESVMPSNHLILCRPLLLRPQSFPASGSFPVSQLFASGGQITGASALASVLPMNIQDWFPLQLSGLISLLSKGLLDNKHPSIIHRCLAFFKVQLSHPCMTTGKTIALTIRMFVSKVMSLLFSMLCGSSSCPTGNILTPTTL